MPHKRSTVKEGVTRQSPIDTRLVLPAFLGVPPPFGAIRAEQMADATIVDFWLFVERTRISSSLMTSIWYASSSAKNKRGVRLSMFDGLEKELLAFRTNRRFTASLNVSSCNAFVPAASIFELLVLEGDGVDGWFFFLRPMLTCPISPIRLPPPVSGMCAWNQLVTVNARATSHTS